MDVVPRSKADEGKAPDDNPAGVEERIAGLIRSAEAAARRPEDKDGPAAEIVFRDEAEIAAIAAVGVVVAKA